MKKYIVAVVFAFAAMVLAEDRPAYTNEQNWVFLSGLNATNALNAINGNARFPINKDVGGGKTYKMIKWVDAVEYSDNTNSPIYGKWYFQRIPPKLLDYHKYPEALRQAWYDIFCASDKATAAIQGTNSWKVVVEIEEGP